jgi:hypothetical protein
VVVDAEVVVDNPDAVVEIEGSEWSSEATIEITYETEDGESGTIQNVVTDQDGGFQVAQSLPDGVDPETTTFTVTDTATGESQTFTLAGTGDGTTVAQADDDAADDDGAALASTGAPTGAMALSVTLVSAGLLVLAGARWRGRRLAADG